MARQVIFHKRYFLGFYERQTLKVQEKIEWTLGIIRTIPRVPETYLKHIEGTEGLYEIRVESGRNAYRIFSFFDEGNLIVLMNGFQKKTQKTPKRAIDIALNIRKDYYDEKKK